MKHILLAFILLFSISSFADAILDKYIPTTAPSKIVKHGFYYVCFNSETKTPYWVIYHLNKTLDADTVDRTGKFTVDPLILESPNPLNYSKSGYDTGHICTAEDAQLKPEWQSETMYTSNLCPQIKEFNRGIWKKTENLVRKLAQSGKDLIIIAGPIYDNSHPRLCIGQEKIKVPTAFFKIIYDINSKEILVFVIPHQKETLPLDAFKTTLSNIESLTHMKLINLD